MIEKGEKMRVVKGCQIKMVMMFVKYVLRGDRWIYICNIYFCVSCIVLSQWLGHWNSHFQCQV